MAPESGFLMVVAKLLYLVMACMAVFTLVLVVGAKWTQSKRRGGYAQIKDDFAARGEDPSRGITDLA